MTGAATGAPKRETYRHGDLRRALVAAGVEMARRGGPEAVVLREATRQAGVAPSAAYRHFTDRRALLDAICSAALAELAEAMEAELAGLPRDGEPDGDLAARARFGAVGRGYLRFAREEPGLFRTAFSASENLGDTTSPSRAEPRSWKGVSPPSPAFAGLAVSLRFSEAEKAVRKSPGSSRAKRR